MLNVQLNVLSVLKNDATLASLMNTLTPNLHIYMGARDIVIEKQSDIQYPAIIITVVSESDIRIPIHGHESRLQIDVWSRNSELEAVKIYDQIRALLSYQNNTTSNSTTIWWSRIDSASEDYNSEMVLWRYKIDVFVWSFN